MLPRITKLITDQASIISNEINKHFIYRLNDFSTMEECSNWFMSPDGQQVMDRCIYMGLGLEPKRPRKKLAYSFFSKDRKPPSLQEGRAMWKVLPDEEKQVYEQMATDEYQLAIRRFTEAYMDVTTEPVAKSKPRRSPVKRAKKKVDPKSSPDLAQDNAQVVDDLTNVNPDDI